MITVRRLRELLAELPDNARVWGYEGEDIGISISDDASLRSWWIRATHAREEDSYTEGFDSSCGDFSAPTLRT